MCDNMRWNHLPVDGGLYDQHPALLDKFRYIFAERNRHQAEEDARRKSEAESKRRTSTPRRPGRPSRTR